MSRSKYRFFMAGAGCRPALALAAVIAVLPAGGCGKKEPAHPAAFLVPADDASFEQLARRGAGWDVVPSGRHVSLPDGVRAHRVPVGGGTRTTLTGPAKLSHEAPPPPDKFDALASPLPDLAAWTYSGKTERAGTVHVTSPFGVTRFTAPEIDWVAADGINYDVVVVDLDDPDVRWAAVRVRPPLAFAKLESVRGARELRADRLYAVAVREAGSDIEVGLMRFLVTADADATPPPGPPDVLLLEAASAMAKKPTRTGDAWLALSRLPEKWAGLELALRLRLLVAAELGLADEVAATQARLGARTK
jgi:hypothetical protein